MKVTETELRELICEAGRRMYGRNLVGATDGNISAKLGENRYLCTPSSTSKGFMRPEDLIIADGEGNKIDGNGAVTTEFFTHLAAYEERPDISAVVHGHPPTATALTLAGLDMTRPVIPELIMGLVAVPTTDYATPGSKEGADVIRKWIRQFDAVLLDRHGAVTVGKDVMEAYMRIEKVEHSAQALFAAHVLGRVRELDPSQIERLLPTAVRHGSCWTLYPF